jgi:hypothetical protein
MGQPRKKKKKKKRRRRSRVNDAKRFKDKRGQGEFENYIPWIWVTDFSPHSTKWRIPGVKVNRLHHALSTLEARVFYILESMASVLEIREQFPLLPLLETIEIAASNNIKHPKELGIPTVRTIDFLVMTQTRTIAISVKYKKGLTPRNLELLEIERQYFKRRGIEFIIILDTSITRPQYKNAKRIRAFVNRPSCKIDNEELVKALAAITQPELKTKIALKEIASKFQEQFKNVHHLFLHLIYIGQIKIDTRKIFFIDSTLSDLCYPNLK